MTPERIRDWAKTTATILSVTYSQEHPERLAEEARQLVNEAFDEAAKECERGLDDTFNDDFKVGMRACANSIRALKLPEGKP